MSSLAPDVLPVPSAEVVRSERGTVYIWHPAPTVFVTRAEGCLTERAARAICVAGRKVIAADGRLVVFQDWEELTDYEREARIVMTKMGLEFRRHVELSHFLVRARIVALGIQLANVVLGNLRVQPSRRALEEVLRSTIRARQTGRSSAPA
jgi:hypothetical protein